MGVSRKERRGRKGSRKGPSVNTTAVSFKILIFYRYKIIACNLLGESVKFYVNCVMALWGGAP